MRSLNLTLFWIATAVCLIAQLALLRSAFAVYAARPDHPGRWKELAWSVLPALMLAVLLVAAWRVVTVADPGTSMMHSLSRTP